MINTWVKPPQGGFTLNLIIWIIRNKGQCVISGFSFHLEREVLHFLMKGHQPIILVLARQMYNEIPSELQSLLDDNRL